MLTPKKRHGLWQWHLAVRTYQDGTIKWWVGDWMEIEKAERAVAFAKCSFSGLFEQMRPMSAIAKCANRWFRMNKQRVTVKDWNTIVETIGRRMGAHERSIQACLIKSKKACRPITYRDSEICPAHEKWDQFDIETRARQMRASYLAGQAKRLAEEKRISEMVCLAYETSLNKWCEIPEKKHRWDFCMVCSAYKGPVVLHNFRGPDGLRVTNEWYREHPPDSVYEMCSKRFCQVLGKTVSTGRKQTVDYLIKVIYECVVKKGDNPVYRRVADNFARNAWAVRERGNRSHPRKNRRQNV